MFNFDSSPLLKNAALGSLLTLGFVGTVQPAQAQSTIPYCISVKTYTDSGSGTDNPIYMTMHGENGTSEQFTLQGSHENNDLDEFVHETLDIGLINRVTIDVDGWLADKWAANYVRVYRDTTCNRKDDADGWSEFSIRKFLDYDPVSFNRTGGALPRVTVTPAGPVVNNPIRITLAQFSNNPGTLEQEVMRITESWSRVDGVSVSKDTTNTVGAGISITYESPETVAGTFGAEARAEWQRSINEASSESQEKMSASEFNWAFMAPAHTAIIRKITFEVPYAEQVYRSSTGESRAIRKVGAQIRPVSSGDFLVIPQRNEDGSITTIGLDTLEDEWFTHLDPDQVDTIRRQYLPKWLQAGWVVSGQGGQIIGQTPSTPAPPTNPTPPVNPTTPTPNAVTGTLIKFANGYLQETSPGVWQEFNANGQVTFTFQETGRDDWSVYLNDASRNVQLQLDLYRKMISYGQNNGPKSDLYPITASDVTLARFANGHLQETSPGVWQEFNANGQVTFTFQETGRDDWSIYLNDPSRNVQLQLDVYRKMISYGQNNEPKSDLYAVTSFYR
ncbi:PLAT/LH2 domain-containing protein [Picosynechococcus sp. NKBG042902]|uniref:PLAT/LH2 domain-containing protein n=1 Tax=Picosynechococcus sp. NKBG042902 TaxID=490193 RepID=UPI0004ABB903|nr:PLAT/LH2 domain-containing protein [Picosynechococcus sp. NKBG042902]